MRFFQYLLVCLAALALVVHVGVQFHDQGMQAGPLMLGVGMKNGPPGKPHVPQFTLFSQRLESVCQVITGICVSEHKTRDTDARDLWSDRGISRARLLAWFPALALHDGRGEGRCPSQQPGKWLSPSAASSALTVVHRSGPSRPRMSVNSKCQKKATSYYKL